MIRVGIAVDTAIILDLLINKNVSTIQVVLSIIATDWSSFEYSMTQDQVQLCFTIMRKFYLTNSIPTYGKDNTSMATLLC